MRDFDVFYVLFDVYASVLMLFMSFIVFYFSIKFNIISFLRTISTDEGVISPSDSPRGVSLQVMSRIVEATGDGEEGEEQRQEEFGR